MVAEALSSNTVHLVAGGALVAVALAVVYHQADRPTERSVDASASLPLSPRRPVGTLVAIAAVVAVYLFVQSGLENPNRPVVIPFRSWSYFYPEGMLWSGLAHSGRSHITGNLLSTLVAGALAEYAYGHFPDSREIDDEPGPVRSALSSAGSSSATVSLTSLPSRASLLPAHRSGNRSRSGRSPANRSPRTPTSGRSLSFRGDVVVRRPGVAVRARAGDRFLGRGVRAVGFALVFYPVTTIAALTGRRW